MGQKEILSMLRRYWGYESFRPLQEKIVRSILDGRDTCVVMPTGGGKSLCYQLPAAMMSGKTAIVISPLIALMQDQSAQLDQMGIPAALLNSSIPRAEQSKIQRQAESGAYRLLYLSPERIATPDTVAWLKRLPISFFAIDEAHCISEWGHEFRPEYRQLSSLRKNFPDRPIAAFTASATKQVRHDIVQQLKLRDPDKYIMSFHRSNLRYVLKQCTSKTQIPLLLQALHHYADSNVIVYAPTINSVEDTVSLLEAHGIPAIGYHGKMDTDERRQNQERWMADEVRVMVGTVAFGLGINKPDVRAVIHLSLPKSIEQYYQEAGRAGRDGAPADCLLLWQKKDVGLLTYFILKLSDGEEKQRAWERYRIIRAFVESTKCRHHQVCLHFGENPKWQSCNACDICGYQPGSLSNQTRPSSPPRSLATPLAQPSKSSLPAPTSPTQHSFDPNRPLTAEELQLRVYLREWRFNAAKEKSTRPFIIFHDTTLEALCRLRPQSISEIRAVPGFGERKTDMYGQQILAALERFRLGARAERKELESAAEQTKRLLAEGRTFLEISGIRGIQLSTVYALVANLVEAGEIEFDPDWIEDQRFEIIQRVCERVGIELLKPIKEALPEEFSYGEIRLVVSFLKSQSGDS